LLSAADVKGLAIESLDAAPRDSPAIRALVSVFVATVLSLLVYLSPFREAGSDLSQRLLLLFDAPGGAVGVDTALKVRGARPRDWILVDIGERFCDLGNGGVACPPESARTDRAALALLVEAIRAQRPRLVVVSLATDTKIETPGDDLLRATLRKPGAPVLLAWSPQTGIASPNREGVSIIHFTATDSLLPPAESLPAARYFPAIQHTDGQHARLLVPYYLVATDTHREMVPSLAFAAALVALSDSSDPWSLVDQFKPSKVDDETTQQCRAQDAGCAKWFGKTERAFSFLPFVPGLEARYASPSAPLRLTPPAMGAQFGERMTDSVVVIGDTRAVAGGRFWSAIGNVSAAELILNDIRQFSESRPHPKPTLRQRLAHEVPFLIVGGLAVWFVGRHFAHAARAISPLLSSIAEFFAITVTTVVLFVGLLYLGRKHLGIPPDFVTPFFAMLAEKSFELMHRATNSLHKGLHHVLRKLQHHV
jgi:hypothetical protein